MDYEIHFRMIGLKVLKWKMVQMTHRARATILNSSKLSWRFSKIGMRSAYTPHSITDKILFFLCPEGSLLSFKLTSKCEVHTRCLCTGWVESISILGRIKMSCQTLWKVSSYRSKKNGDVVANLELSLWSVCTWKIIERIDQNGAWKCGHRIWAQTYNCLGLNLHANIIGVREDWGHGIATKAAPCCGF